MMKVAPRLCTCSAAAALTSNAFTTAPSRRAVADCLKACDAGSQHDHGCRSNRAGAVDIMGKMRGRTVEASRTI